MGDVKQMPPKDYLFKKGQSGNPKGRPKKKLPTEDYDKALEMLVPKALQRLQEILDNNTIPAREMLKAVDSVLDRRYGKATQRIESTVEKVDYSKIETEDLIKMAQERIEAVKKQA